MRESLIYFIKQKLNLYILFVISLVVLSFIRYDKFFSPGYLFCKSTYIKSTGYEYTSIKKTCTRGFYIETIGIKGTGGID